MVNERILAAARERALAVADRHERYYQFGLLALFLWEALLVVVVVLLVDFSDPLHRLVLVSTGVIYASLGLGFTLLAVYVRRVSLRTLVAIEALLGDGREVTP